MDQLDVGVIVQDRDSAIIYSNRRAAQLLNVRREEVLGRASDDPLWEVVRADGSEFPHWERPVARALATRKPVNDVVLGVRLASGRRSWILANAMPKLDAAGEVEHVVVTLSDISSERRRMSLLQQVAEELEVAVSERTAELAGSVRELRREAEQRERAEAALARSESLYRSVLRTMAEGVTIHAADGTLNYANPAAERILGLTLRQLRGTTPIDPRWTLLRPDSTPLLPSETPTEITRRTGQPCQQVLIGVRHVDGQRTWVVVHTDPLDYFPGREEGGESGVIATTFSDVTEVREAQRREAIGTVTAGIAHNFNNSLAVIVPNLEGCLAEAPEPLRQPLRESLSTARNAADLVRQLMFIARGGLGDELVHVDLSDVVQQTAAMFRPLLRGRVEVRESNSAGHVRVRSPPSALQQVLLNLCINARDALTGVDEARVEISLELRDGSSTADGSSGARAVLRVRDNGRGMEEDVRARLGEPFFSTKSPGSGTGLGLATAFATVRELGGGIECISAPGEGCEFVISLPVADYGRARPQAVRPCCSSSDTQQARVLLVDDEPLVRRALSQVLARRGHRVDQAGTGAEALERVRDKDGNYDAVLLDLSMPGLSGESVLATLAHEAPELPVLVLSGFVEDPAAIGHARLVLQKPVATRTLIDALSQILSHKTADA